MTDRPDSSKSDPSGDPHRDLAGVLHDVANALTVLLGWVGEACAPNAAPATVAHALALIEERARVARDLARHAIGAPVAEDRPRDVAMIAAEVLESLSVEAGHRGVLLALKTVDSPVNVSGALDVAQVLSNLVLNAIAFSPEGAAVEVDVTGDDETCGIVVTDHGDGVPEALRERIFEGASLRSGGTGVGLRHSRALARARGGDVMLEASSPSAGASFRVSWPRADVAPRPRVSPARAQELAGLRVLLIEDDVAVTQLLETALEGRGADVTIVATGAELPAALDAGPYDTALVDLSPLAEDASGAIARLRASSPRIDLVLITGNADRLPEAVAAERMKLVRKPFEMSEILAVFDKSDPR